jgi:hypothetical protein
MARTNRERIGTALDLFVAGYRPFIIQQMDARHGGEGLGKATEYIQQRAKPGMKTASGPDEWDTANIITVILTEWQYLFRLKLGKSERGMLNELEEIRNDWAHQQAFGTDDTLRALDTIQRLLSAVSAAEQGAEVEKLKGELMRTRFSEIQRTASGRAKRSATEGTPLEGLPPWRDVITPHPDVCSGTFAQAEFAADLAQVYRGDALAEYGDPKEFFRRTYLTEGLSGLLLNAIKRFSGKGGHPVIQLQTNFGGGKTHSMLGLYHLVSGVPVSDLTGLDVLMNEAGVKALPKAKRAVLVGTALSAGQPETTRDGFSLRTLWGRLAYQLGGKEAYALIEQSDLHGTSPGSDDLVKLFKKVGPALILIDEWIAYCRQMYETPGLPGGSFDSNITFAQSLTEAVKASPTALLVASLPQSDIEVGGEGGKRALERLAHTFERIEFNWRPASAEESYEIVRRRLFEPVTDPKLFGDRDAVVRAFGTQYRQNPTEFPSECKEADYEQRMDVAYPIHPELFDRLYNDWSSLEEFQRTRGVLRLMAAVIHTLWARQDRSLVILPSLLPIDEPAVQSELTRYLTPNWPVIIEKDVDGPNSLPKRMDTESPRFGRLWATRRVARTIYIGSAPVAGQANKGLDIRRIRLGCVQPGENIAVFGDALRQLGDQAAHLYADGARYWYSTQPNVGHVARDRAAQQEDGDVLEEIRLRLRKQQGQRGGFAKVYPAPESTSEVPDEADGRLVVLAPEKTHTSGVDDSPALQAAMEFLEKRGNGQRVYRNALVFLAADKTRLTELHDACAQYRAWKSIHDERGQLGLDPFNAKLAEKKVGDFDNTIDARLPETFQWLLAPEQPDARGKTEWQAIRLSGSGSLAARAFTRLERDGLITGTLAGTFLRHHLDKVLWSDQDHLDVRQVQEYFAQYLYLPRLTYKELVIDAIRDGIASLTWQSDTFAYAGGYDEENKRYVGLQAGRTGVAVVADGRSVIVKPDVARAQIDKETSASKESPGEATEIGPGGELFGSASVGAGAKPGAATPSLRPTRFHASITVDPTRLGRDAATISAEIVQHLAAKLGTRVEIVIDIDAHIPDGADEATVRTITENCRTLGFEKGAGFEP